LSHLEYNATVGFSTILDTRAIRSIVNRVKPWVNAHIMDTMSIVIESSRGFTSAVGSAFTPCALSPSILLTIFLLRIIRKAYMPEKARGLVFFSYQSAIYYAEYRKEDYRKIPYKPHLLYSLGIKV